MFVKREVSGWAGVWFDSGGGTSSTAEREVTSVSSRFTGPSTTMRRLSRWAGFLKRQFWWPTMLGCGTVEEEALPPKGHLAVYVCGVEMDRVATAALRGASGFVNHPLFGELLKEAEEGLGFHHLGGITIPCSIFRFELVQARIAAGLGRRSGLRRYRRL
ncbi:hypothetical protein HPP92_020993 [Vanilla planifolia]|uniref:SAUR family protein n=1 Tax=Vanilla planifolia TaxID=51239 RepID=A0A835PYB0_VANPL|nr:hypothetical protein HPP92_020993 [Vanilla planifolia]